MVFIMIYEVVCMCETRCGDADTNYIRNTMEKGGFDIVFFFKNRSARNRHKSGGRILLETLNMKWKDMKSNDETLFSICVDKRYLGLEQCYNYVYLHFPQPFKIWQERTF